MRMTGTKSTMRLLMTLMVLLLADMGHAHAQGPYFPELVFFPENQNVNSIVDDMTSVHLKAMREPSLWDLSQKDRQAKAYRFLWLATGQHPISVRLTRIGDTYVLHVAGHDGPPGLTAGRLSLNRDVMLTEQQGQKLVALLEGTKFWSAPVEVKESRGIGDGDKIVIEGVKDGKYHVIVRAGSTTGESYKAFCRSLLELADEPGVLEAWDRFRQSERESPEYLPEPPQTEDRGDPEPDAEGP